MTTPIIPGFIGDLFQREIFNIQKDTAMRICQIYNLNIDEVMTKINIKDVKVEHPRLKLKTVEQNPSLKLSNINIGESRLRIYWRYNTKYGDNKCSPKCIAVSAYKTKEKIYIQCCRSKQFGFDFCESHIKTFLNNKLQYGTIYDHEQFEDVINDLHEEDNDEIILEQCIARIYEKNERTLEQCTRIQKDETTPLCTIHAKQKQLQYGTINDPEPECVFKKKAHKIY